MVAHHGNHVEHDEAHDDHVKLLVGDYSKYNCLKLKVSTEGIDSISIQKEYCEKQLLQRIDGKDNGMNLWSPGRPWECFCGLFVPRLLHRSYVLPLVLGHERVQRRSSLVLLLVELVDDDANEKVQGEETSKHDEGNKVDVEVKAVFKARLVIQLKIVR